MAGILDWVVDISSVVGISLLVVAAGALGRWLTVGPAEGPDRDRRPLASQATGGVGRAAVSIEQGGGHRSVSMLPGRR
jgi:hypothetical protein